MKKQIGIFTALLFAVSTLMVGCKAEVHTHTFAEERSSDETNHWHAATCECSDVELQKTEHTFGDWTITKEPTEEAEGSQEKSCSVCEYKVTEEIAKLEHKHKFATEWTKDETNHWHASTCGHEVTEGKTAHTFGDWTTTKEATCTEEGNKTRTCEVCKKEITEKIPAKGHNYSETWTSDTENHWHASTCGHEDEEVKEEHTFVDEVCTICKYSRIPEGFVFVKGTTITGTESWTPYSFVFVSGRSLTIPDLIVSDHEVTRGEYKDVMGSDPSTARAYDKDGNKLEGDAVLNNPVNEVSWYDALVYCNKRSMAEGLTPCYSIKGSTDPKVWAELPTEGDDPLCDTWDAATCNFKVNGYRLPTEAEWEWLARGGENYKYAGSDTIDYVAWYWEKDTGTRDVKTKAPNGYGLYDMSGNVYEWCWDWYGDDISSSSAADGALSDKYRVQRGGCFCDFGDGCLVYVRGRNRSYYRYDYFGFRVVRQAN